MEIHCKQDEITHEKGMHHHLSGELSYATTVSD